MNKIDSNREFKLEKTSFSDIKKINLKEIGFNKTNKSNIFLYESDEYKILNHRIKPILEFFIDIKDNKVFIKLIYIKIKYIPNIFKVLKVIIELNILPEGDFCKVDRYISLRYEENNNKLLQYISKNFTDKLLNKLIEKISKRFDDKLMKKVLKII